MTWKPTPGMRLAEPIVRRLIQESEAVDLELRDPVFAHHVVTVFAQALDEALEDPAMRVLGPGPVFGEFGPKDETPVFDTTRESKRGRKPLKAKKLRRPAPEATAVKE